MLQAFLFFVLHHSVRSCLRQCRALVFSVAKVLRDFFAAQLQGTRFFDFFCLSDFPAGRVCAGLIPRAFCCLHRSHEQDPVSSRMRTAQERVLVPASLTSVRLFHSLSPPGWHSFRIRFFLSAGRLLTWAPVRSLDSCSRVEGLCIFRDIRSSVCCRSALLLLYAL
jgi:hypothetical protein